MVHVNETVTENEAEDVKYLLANPKYRFYVRYGKDLVGYIMSNMYVMIERFIVLCRPLKITIRVQGVKR